MGRLEDWIASAPKRPGEFARPLVTLSYAQSIDGSIALRRGQPLALSGAESLMLTHQLRAVHDAVLVGIGTILADDPQLNARLATGKDPQVIVLDSRLRIPPKAKVIARRPRVFSTALADAKVQKALEAAGVQIERQDSNSTERVDLKLALARLHELGINTLMVEGGGQVTSSFLVEGLVDRAVVTVTPRYIGGYKAVEFPSDFHGKLPRFRDLQFERHGEDLVVWGDLVRA